MERAKRFFGGRMLKNARARAFQTWKLHYTFVCRVREAEDREETETRRKNQARVRAQRMVRRWTLRTIAVPPASEQHVQLCALRHRRTHGR